MIKGLLPIFRLGLLGLTFWTLGVLLGYVLLGLSGMEPIQESELNWAADLKK